MRLRRRFTAAAGSIALLAGGLFLSGAPATAEDQITFTQPVRMQMQGHVLLSGASEPSIALDSDGTIYITAACCLPVAAPAWYSKDGGKTFQLMRTPGGFRESTIGAEGDFIVDDADRAILADTRIPSIVVSRWRDHGDTWDRSLDATEITAPLQDRPWLAWGGGAAYLYVNGGLQNTYVYRSFDGGLTWNPLPVGSFSNNFPTNLAANRQDGAVWLVGRNGFTSRFLESQVSTDGGETWFRTDVATATRQGVSPTTGISVATDEAGNGYAAWSTFDANGCHIEMATSTDHGRTWRGPFRVNEGDGCGTFVWLDAGLPGRVAVTWFQSDTPKNQAQMPGSATWHLHAAVSTDALSDAPSFTEARLGTHVVDRGTLTTGYGQPGGSSRSLLDFIEIAAGPDGRFHIAYARNEGQDGTDETWYTSQASGPLLRANRIAEATTVAIEDATRDGETLTVRGASEFKRAPVTTLFEPGLAPDALLGGEVTRVGPDSDELLATILLPGTGVEAYDNLPTAAFWALEAGGEGHLLELTTTPAGNRFLLDGSPIGGTVDQAAGKAIARLSLSALGAEPGDTVRFVQPSPFVETELPATAGYEVPEATVTLSLQQGGTEVASGAASLTEVYDAWTGSLDVTGLSGDFDLVATACYAGDCATASSQVSL